MTRKRFVKLLMADLGQRNYVNYITRILVPKYYKSYQECFNRRYSADFVNNIIEERLLLRPNKLKYKEV